MSIHDVLVVAGAGLIVTGVSAWSGAAACIVAGVALLAIGLPATLRDRGQGG